MAVDYVVKANTRPGSIVIGLAYSDGSFPDLTPSGTVATFRMRPYQSNPAIIAGECDILDAKTVAYPWEAGQLNGLVGLYECEVAVVWMGGRSETFPADEVSPYFLILVEAEIATV